MTSTEIDATAAEVYVDHRETVICAPGPRTLSASKQEMTSSEVPSDQPAPGAEVRTDPDKQETTTPTPATVTVVTQHVTTIYTQKIGGAKAGSAKLSQDEGSSRDQALAGNRAQGEAAEGEDGAGGCEDLTDVVNNNSLIVGGPPPLPAAAAAAAQTEICSIEVSIGDVPSPTTSTTTTAFSKVFGKTVDATTSSTTAPIMEASATSASKERHLSECSISVSGHGVSNASQETGYEVSLSAGASKEEEEEEEEEGREQTQEVKDDEDKVAEYNPGLAIRALTLEGLLEKRVSPDGDAAFPDQTQAAALARPATDLSTLSAADKTNDGTVICQTEGTSALSHDGVASAAESFSVSSETVALSRAAEAESVVLQQQQGRLLDTRTAGGQLLMQCTDDAAPVATKLLFNPIEVERKFTIDDNTEARLRALGAQLRVEKVFHDVYYDNDNYTLILGDCWLRRRNDVWEARVPARSTMTSSPLTPTTTTTYSPHTQYRELSSEKAISAWLVECLGLDAWLKGDPMELVVQAAGLGEFAHVITTRRSYTLPSCTVDLDFTDYGFRVGEIEVMAASPEDVPRALKTISGVAEQLGKARERSI